MFGFLLFLVSPAARRRDVTDGQLLQRYLDGESEAFGTLVRRYEKPLYGFLSRFCGDGALAEDVFQETFLQVYRSAGMFDADRPFRPWLFTVAANKARDAMRKRGRRSEAPLDAPVGNGQGRPTTFADLLASEMPSPDEISVNQETRRDVQALVQELPEHLREVLALSYFKELPHKEIAEILDVPVGTVKSRLHAAVRAFAEKWKIYAAKQHRDGPDD